MPKFDKKSITAVDIVIAKVDEEEWDKHYLLNFLNSKLMADVGESLATGSTRQRISRKNMGKITIPKPPLEEQSEIADVLQLTQRLIIHEDKIRDQHQSMKRGLMQDLLTGDTRGDPNT